MKMFSRILATSIALALAFGMTVCAESPNTGNTGADAILKDQANVVNGSIKAPEGATAYATAATTEDYNNVLDKVEDPAVSQIVASVLNLPGVQIGEPLMVVDLYSDQDNVELQFSVPGTVAGKLYVLLHMNEDGSIKEVLPAVCAEDGTITATFTSFSIYAVIEVTELSDSDESTPTPEPPATSSPDAPGTTPAASDATSPKTGMALSAADFMALLLLAGVVLCANRVRNIQD